MLNSITRLGKHAAFETIIFEPGKGTIAYGMGVTANHAKRAAKAVLFRLKLHILACLESRGDTAAGIVERTGKDRETITSLLFLLISENLIIYEECPIRGIVYKRIESAK